MEICASIFLKLGSHMAGFKENHILCASHHSMETSYFVEIFKKNIAFTLRRTFVELRLLCDY